MKPGTADYLAKAKECLDAARKVIAIQLPAVAAKEAYLAACHAAQAFVFEATRKAAKTHSFMPTLFARVAKDDLRIDPAFAFRLANTYKYKEIADYAVGTQSVVTMPEAEEVIDIAARFTDTIRYLLPSCSPPDQP
nr:HEPN domain-containing protein [uncultured Rhodopila sp.]